MRKNSVSRSGIFHPRALVGFALCAPGAVAAMFSFAMTLPSQGPYPRPGYTQRASVAYNGGQSALFASFGGISSNGRVAVWGSNLSDSSFVPDDTNGKNDVFARDIVSGQTVRVSVASDGTQADLGSSNPAVSGDGRYVVFISAATNLVPGDPGNGPFDNLFVHDLATRTTVRASISTSSGEPPNDPAINPKLSYDGRFVVFLSYASNLVAEDTNLYPDIYVLDRATGNTEVVSVDSNGEVKDGGALYFDISADGRYIAFSSLADGLVSGDSNGRQDVFVHDRLTGETEIVSISTNGAAGNRDSRIPSISDDGRYVAFESFATTLVPQDTNAAQDIFVRDRVMNTTRRVSATSSGAEAQSGQTPFAPGSFFASLSPEGRYVAFQSDAPNLMPDDTADFDVFIHDLVTASTTPVTFGLDGLQPDKGAGSPAIGADGRFVGFSSNSTNLVPEGNDQWHDVFVHDRGPSLGIGALSAQVVDGTVMISGWATFSGAVISSVTDPSGDGAAGADPAGADLTGASLSYRPENGDLLIRLNLASLPPAALGGGAPAVLYGLGFDLGGARYEVRAVRTGLPTFALYRCDAICTEQATLSGGIGATGLEVSVSIPLAALGAEEGSALTAVEAFTAFGQAPSGSLVMLDEADLLDATISVQQVSLGIAPAGTPEADVAFDTAATLVAGMFSGTLPGLTSGNYNVWARACLGVTCGPAVSWPPTQLVSVVSRKVHGSIIPPFDINLPLSGTRGIESRGTGTTNNTYTLIFTFSNNLINSGSTSASVTGHDPASGTGSVSSSEMGPLPNQYTVNLTGVSTGQYITVTLNNVVDEAGNSSNVLGPQMGVLVGDVNFNGTTNNTDVGLVKAEVTVPVDGTNFRNDVNASGTVNNTDVGITKAQVSAQLP